MRIIQINRLFDMFSLLSGKSSMFTKNPRSVDDNSDFDLEPVDINDVEIFNNKSFQTLKHLMKLNHIDHSILYNENQFHNHMPHVCPAISSLKLKLTSSDPMFRISFRCRFGKASEIIQQWIWYSWTMEGLTWRAFEGWLARLSWRWKVQRVAVTIDCWHEINWRRFCRAYVDFFEDQLISKGYDWRKLVEEFLFNGPEPLINSLICGCIFSKTYALRVTWLIVQIVGHPLIHLGYAYEVSSRELAVEALGLASTCYSCLHEYLDDSKYSRPSRYTSSSPLDILERISTDSRLDDLLEEPGSANINVLLSDHEELVLEHWNALRISNSKKLFEETQIAATSLLVATNAAGRKKYDFFLAHILTTSHAVRVLLPHMPLKYHITLVKQWWLLTVVVYMSQLRPSINLGSVLDYDLQGKEWRWVDTQALEGKYATDAHYVKALRSMKEAAKTWGDESQFYIKSAARLGSEFDGWGGFAPGEVQVKP